MKRPLKAEEVRLWTVVASTVRPAPGRGVPNTEPEKETAKSPLIPAQAGTQPSQPLRPKPVSPAHLGPRLRGDEREKDAIQKTSASNRLPDSIEPLRKRRIARERDPIGARLDLHGLDQDRARLVLHGFLQRAYAEGHRAVLVITGKGTLGDGVLRRRAPDWLSEPQVRPLIAGFSPAERHHGGEGALYIALKRRRA